MLIQKLSELPLNFVKVISYNRSSTDGSGGGVDIIVKDDNFVTFLEEGDDDKSEQCTIFAPNGAEVTIVHGAFGMNDNDKRISFIAGQQ